MSSVKIYGCHLSGYRSVMYQRIGLFSVKLQVWCLLSEYRVVNCQGIMLSSLRGIGLSYIMLKCCHLSGNKVDCYLSGYRFVIYQG